VAARLTAYIVAVIVGVTFIAGLIVGAQREDNGPVDLMVVNGHVYTADGEHTDAEAVAIQGNKILRVGSTREIQRLRRAQTVVIDAKGGAVLPGFIETDARLLDRVSEPAVVPVGPLPPPTRDDDFSTIRATTREAHRRGITSIQTSGGSADDLELLDELRRDGSLSLRVYATLSVASNATRAEIDALDDLRSRFSDDPLLKAGAVRIVVDAEAGPVTPAALQLLVTELDRRGWQIVLEARGDREIEMALNAYKHVVETNPAPARGRRHRIEQTASIGPTDFALFEAIGVAHPSSPEPQAIDEAIDALTREAAYASFDEHRKGMLVRDMLADLVVLTKDVLAQPSTPLSEAEVSVTIFDGKVVFQKGV
jgi:predicted amidohydrolase YtcJ